MLDEHILYYNEYIFDEHIFSWLILLPKTYHKPGHFLTLSLKVVAYVIFCVFAFFRFVSIFLKEIFIYIILEWLMNSHLNSHFVTWIINIQGRNFRVHTNVRDFPILKIQKYYKKYQYNIPEKIF